MKSAFGGNIKKFLVGTAAGALMLGASIVPAFGAGPTNSNGLTPYADVYVTWDGVAALGDWWVDRDLDGDLDENYGCDDCVGVDYNFVFRGKTLQFDEVYVDAVEAHPQTHHVVLTEEEDGIYKGAITARYNYAASTACPVRMDVIEYTVDTNQLGTDGYFNYIEHEYCLPTK